MVSAHKSAASQLRDAILDLHWNNSTLAFYDYNMTANARNTQFTVATYYPAWAGLIPDEVLASETAAQGYFASVNLVLSRYNGTYPTTFVESGLQWDAPNAWPPHIYIVMQALLAMPSNITKSPLPTGGNGSFAALPSGQLGMDESGLPPQPMNVGGSINATGKDADVNFANGTWHNGGNATDGEGWRDALARGIAKYVLDIYFIVNDVWLKCFIFAVVMSAPPFARTKLLVAPFLAFFLSFLPTSVSLVLRTWLGFCSRSSACSILIVEDVAGELLLNHVYVEEIDTNGSL
jgi:hypothetical protein